MTAVLYVTRTGMLEPLGQSQVLAYLRGLSRDYRITLISFEKSEDFSDTVSMERVLADCAAHGIRWIPQRFHRYPRVLAPAWNMMTMLMLCLREIWFGGASMIHARAYLPAVVAMLAGALTRTPFIFDMRALWPEELITAGRLRRGSLTHRAIVRAERACLKRAAAVVSLTHAAVGHLQGAYPSELSAQNVTVIPTCADLDRFKPLPIERVDTRTFGCVGTVLSGWFRVDWLSAFLEVAARRDPEAEFHIVTRDDPERLRAALGAERNFSDRLNVYSKALYDVHEAIQVQTASIMFFASGLAKIGSSPTRMAEILGCGVPVIVNDGVGDVAAIVRQYHVGVVVEDGSIASMETAFDALLELESDPRLSARCRQAAEEVFSLDSGIAAYGIVYRNLLAGEPRTNSRVAGRYGKEDT